MKDIKKLLSMLDIKARPLVKIIISIIIISVTNYANPFITQKLIDEGMIDKDLSKIIQFSSFIILLTVISGVFHYIKENNRLKIYNDSYLHLEKMSLSHLSKIKVEYFKETNVTGLLKMIEDDIAIMTSVVSNDTLDVVSSFIAAIAGGMALFKIDYHLGLAILAFIPVDYILTRLLSKKNYKIIVDKNTKTKEYNEHFGESFNGIEEVRILGMQHRIQKNLLGIIKEILKLTKKQNILRCVMQQSQFLLIEIIIAVLYVISGFLLVKDQITIGGIIAFQTYALMLVDPIESAIDMLFEISSLQPSIQRFVNFLKIEEEESGCEREIEMQEIRFVNTSFSYNNQSEQLFDSINLSIKRGDKIIITGNNGAGKTTLIKLLLRFYKPQKGQILINNREIEDFDLEYYRSIFAVVSQNIYLFNTTIKNNISVNNDCSEEDLMKIIQLVNLKEFIDEKGLDYNVGVNGSKLSGGQIQKNSISKSNSTRQTNNYIR